jgi:hypothetical protein
MLVAADAGCALMSGAQDGPPPLVTLAVVVDIAVVVDEAVVDTARPEAIKLLKILKQIKLTQLALDNGGAMERGCI